MGGAEAAVDHPLTPRRGRRREGRPGAAGRAPGGAVAEWRAVLRPVEVSPDVWAWRAADESVLDTVALAARCEEFLVQPMAGAVAVAAAG